MTIDIGQRLLGHSKQSQLEFNRQAVEPVRYRDMQRNVTARAKAVGQPAQRCCQPQLIQQRRVEPTDDMLSYVLAAKIDGEPIPEQDILDFCLLMFMAGLDTVATQLTYNLWHLATHDDDRHRLVAEPELWPSAIEELLRFYSFVTPGRKVMKDTEIAGCPIKAGQMVYMPLVSANRDPREFENADQVIIDREVNRHIAFGAGPHRCLGSHLAREELFIAMSMWHERIPEYRIAPGTTVMEHGGQMGISSLPLVWDV